MMSKSFLLMLVALAPIMTSAFVGGRMPRSFVGQSSTTLKVGPLKKFTNRGEYDGVVTGLMKSKGYTREQAEKEYNAFLDNPNDYALQKGEAYYKSLGYKTLMEGVVGEAEKEGKGDEVKARIVEFQKQSKLKGLATISFFIILFFYYKLSYAPPLPPNF